MQLMERSYICSSEGLSKAKKGFKKKGWTQQILADFANCSRPVVSNFFQGKPIDKQKFIGICETLELYWGEIVELETEDKTKLEKIEISQLVAEIRASVKESVEQECGTIRVLDMTRPIELNDIYTQVNILEKIIGRRRFDLEQLLQNCNPEEFDRFGLGQIQQKRVPGLEAVKHHSKLMVLGKPGVGKTTFLKYLAIKCNRGDFNENKIPIFISLKKFAETPGQPDIKEYITQWFENYKIVNASKKVEEFIIRGRGLFLLDGLDEVREDDYKRVIRQIEACHRLFSNNQFVITCRIAARDYTLTPFVEVEVADFDKQQINNFVTSWFAIKKLEDYPQYFMEQLKANPTIKELANNPLLLTLLCLEFEDSGSFPSDRTDLYARATNTLLRKWDDKRHIYREQVYKELNPKRKEGLLSQIAFQTFEKKEYFFKQRTIERYIGNYICNLPNAPTTPDALDVDSQAVLKSIEAQHGLMVERARGIYSFSHLTFQEYFTAKKITMISNPDALETTLANLASHVTEKRWREVFLLTLGMLEPADRLLSLMKQEIDRLIENDQKLQKLLIWAKEKSETTDIFLTSTTIRAFYLSFYSNFDLHLDLKKFSSLDLDSKLHQCLKLSSSLHSSFSKHFSSYLYVDNLKSTELDSKLKYSLNLSLEKCQGSKLELILSQLKEQLPNLGRNEEQWKNWWKDNGKLWINKLRSTIIEHRNIGHKREFNRKQVDLLNQYITANQLLVDCLNSECYVSREVREEIENSLLLPIAHLKS